MGDDREQLPAPLTTARLARLPVFPLPGLSLLPGGLLPLHFFEPRYRQLAIDCLAEPDPCMVIASVEPGAAAGASPPLLPRACVARVLHHRENTDGTHDVMLEGLLRVNLDELPSEHAYRVVCCTPLRQRLPPGGLPPADREAARTLARDIVRLIVPRQPDFELLAHDDDPAALWVDRLGAQFVTDPADRQDLLETLDVPQRLEAVIRHLLTLQGQLREALGDVEDPN